VNDNKEEFLGKLDSHLVALDRARSELEQTGWSKASVAELYDQIQYLVKASSKTDLESLNEATFSAMVYISSFVDAAKSPSKKQQTEILHLLDALNETSRDTMKEYGILATPAEPEDKSPSKPLSTTDTRPIFSLGPGGGIDTLIIDRLRELGFRTESFEHQDHLHQALREEDVRAVIIDTVMLENMDTIIDQMSSLKSQSQTPFSLIFVSGADSLSLRVSAIRAGADAFFAEPIDQISVTNRILEMSLDARQTQRRVLIVEDDPTQAEFVATILGKEDILTSTVTDPYRTLQALEDFHPDLILMDIYMPDVNGIELTSIIRDHYKFMQIPIVFLSGEQDNDKQMDALSVGGDDFVTKPIKPRHLLKVVKHRIQRAKNIQQGQSPQEAYQTMNGLVAHEIFLKRVAAALESESSKQIVVAQVRPDGFDELTSDDFEPILGSIAEISTQFIGPHELITISREHGLLFFLQRNSAEESINEIEKIRSRFEQTYSSSPGKDFLTLSFGLCIADKNNKEPNQLITRAARACVMAQERGGNQLKLFSEDKGTQADPYSEASISNALRMAIANDGFITQFQPLLDLDHRKNEFYEALIRIPSEHGMMLTDRDIREPAANLNLQGKIDFWLLDHVLTLLKDRQEAGYITNIMVHQSSNSAMDPETPAKIKEKLRDLQMVGKGLILDYRLSDLSHDLKMAKRNFNEIRKLGVEICISRFSEKPAAFKVLTYLQADYVSIAPRLLKADKQTIGTIVSQCHALKTRVIVPNIDDPRSIDLHWSSGADYLQGNFIQRPLDQMDYDFAQVVV